MQVLLAKGWGSFNLTEVGLQLEEDGFMVEALPNNTDNNYYNQNNNDNNNDNNNNNNSNTNSNANSHDSKGVPKGEAIEHSGTVAAKLSSATPTGASAGSAAEL